MKKILYVIPTLISYDFSGASRSIAFVGYLRDQGFDAELIGLDSGEKIPNSHLLNPYLSLHSKIRFLLIRICFLLFLVSPILRHRKEMMIIVRDPALAVLLWLPSFLLGIKIVNDFHGLYSVELASCGGARISTIFLHRIFEFLLLKLHKNYLAVNDGIAKMLPLGCNVITVTNGTDVGEFQQGIPAARKRNREYTGQVCFVGRFGLWADIECIASAARLCPDIEFRIIGSGEAIDSFNESTAPQNMKLMGHLSHKETIMEILDCDIGLAAYTSRLPIDYTSNRKIKEYLAAGKPIVISDVAPKDSILKENVNAFFYQAENSVDLAKQVSNLLNDKPLCGEMGKRNRELSMQFSWETVFERSGLISFLLG